MKPKCLAIQGFRAGSLASPRTDRVCGPTALAENTTHHFTVNEVPAIVRGVDEEGADQPALKITAGETKLTCEIGRYDATLTEKTNTDITVTPTYSGCKVHSGGATINATVDVNHCT